MKILVIGAGKMVEALLVGLSQNSHMNNFYIWSPSGKSASVLAQNLGAHFVSQLSESIDPEMIILGCKPQQLKDFKLKLGNFFEDVLWVSLLAAIPEKIQRDILNANKLIRLMPNLAVKYCAGVSLISSESAPEKLSEVTEILKPVGKYLTVTEDELDELTLLTGSGPAFFYYWANAYASQFQSLDKDQREALVRYTLLGSAKVCQYEKDSSLDALMAAVCSKGGVTQELLHSLQTLGADDVLHKSVVSAKKRFQTITEEFTRK